MFTVPCCLDSAPDNRDSVAAASSSIGVTFSSLELSCRLRTHRRRLAKAAKKNWQNRTSTIWFWSSEGAWKSRDKDRGRDEPRGLHWTRRQQNYNARQPIGRVEDAQAQDKLSRRVRKTKTEEQRAAQWKSAEESPWGRVAER